MARTILENDLAYVIRKELLKDFEDFHFEYEASSLRYILSYYNKRMNYRYSIAVSNDLLINIDYKRHLFDMFKTIIEDIRYLENILETEPRKFLIYLEGNDDFKREVYNTISDSKVMSKLDSYSMEEKVKSIGGYRSFMKIEEYKKLMEGYNGQYGILK